MKATTISVLAGIWILLTGYALITGEANVANWINGIIVCVTLGGISYFASIEED